MRTTEELQEAVEKFKKSRFYTTEPGFKWVSNLVDELSAKLREATMTYAERKERLRDYNFEDDAATQPMKEDTK